MSGAIQGAQTGSCFQSRDQSRIQCNCILLAAALVSLALIIIGALALYGQSHPTSALAGFSNDLGDPVASFLVGAGIASFILSCLIAYVKNSKQPPSALNCFKCQHPDQTNRQSGDFTEKEWAAILSAMDSALEGNRSELDRLLNGEEDVAHFRALGAFRVAAYEAAESGNFDTVNYILSRHQRHLGTDNLERCITDLQGPLMDEEGHIIPLPHSGAMIQILQNIVDQRRV